jgi:hypothetical protein
MLLRHLRSCHNSFRRLSSRVCSHDAVRNPSEARIAAYLQSAVGLTEAEVVQVLEKHSNILDLNLEGKRANLLQLPVHSFTV